MLRNHRRQSPALHRAGRQRRNRVRKTALRADDGRRADQEFGAFRVVFGKSHRGGRHGRRAAGNGTQRTPGLQARAGREGRHRGAETVAQGLPPRAASAHPLPRSGAVGPRGAEVHRPLRPGAVARREGLPGPRAPSGRDGHGLHRSRRRLLARRNRLRAGQRFRRDHPRTTASAHRDRGPRGGGHGIGGQRLRIR